MAWPGKRSLSDILNKKRKKTREQVQACLTPEQIQALEDLEKSIGKSLPIAEKIELGEFGVKVEGNDIVGLNLNDRPPVVKRSSYKYIVKLTTLPESIGNLKSLQKLFISHNLTSLPDSIGNLNSLIELYLGGNQLSTFPESIGDLSSLQELSLTHNKLTTLPDSISNLKSLKTLKLGSNQFTALPESIGNLKSLQKLRLEYNKLSTLPESIGKLSSLQTLNLNENQLTTLPDSISNLKSLEMLDIRRNKFTTLPESIGNLKSLTRLSLSYNQFTTLPESIGNLKSLTGLFLSYNKFTTLPVSIWPLKNLKTLELKGNPLDAESKEMLKNTIPIILKFCRERDSIKIFISYAVVDYNSFRIKELSEYLEQQDEIYKAYYCEEDMKGSIDDFMNETIPKCQLLLFFASLKSVFDSKDCSHEIELARTHEIQIVPIKGTDVKWEELQDRGVSRYLGFKFEEKDFGLFCEKLYNYINEFKRTVNLFDTKQARLGKQKLIMRNTISNFFETEEFKDKLSINLEKIEDLFQKYHAQQISPSEYFTECGQILSEKM